MSSEISSEDSNFERPEDVSAKPSGFARIIEFGLQPVLIVAALGLWLSNPDRPAIFLVVMVGVQVLLGALEYAIPARRDWLQPPSEKLMNVAIVIVILVGIIFVAGLYESYFTSPLAELRRILHLDIWPTHWPLLLQVFLAFFVSEFVLYWLHRAMHRWGFFWRLSGHGVHHSFKHLSAINYGVNHPFEIFVLVIPLAAAELFFGAGLAAMGAAVLGTVQTGIVHSNLRLNTRVIGWLFTTNRYHIGHHSIVFEQSNTNYGCSAIIWDRVFGTFGSDSVVEAGIGPREPTLSQKLMMPFREPADSAISPIAVRAPS